MRCNFAITLVRVDRRADGVHNNTFAPQLVYHLFLHKGMTTVSQGYTMEHFTPPWTKVDPQHHYPYVRNQLQQAKPRFATTTWEDNDRDREYSNHHFERRAIMKRYPQ